MDQVKIGKLIAEVRNERNLTQQDLADKVGVTDRAISNWENGRRLPDYSVLSKLCDVLNISIKELMNGEKVNIELKNWFDEEALEKVLIKNYNIDNMTTSTRAKKNINFNIELIILLFNIVNIFLIILFSIVLIITITNIREDESNNKYLLRCLGYNQKEIIYYSSIKISLLFLNSVIINLIVISIVLFLVNLLLVNINIDYYITNIIINISLFMMIFILSFSRYIYYYIKSKVKKITS